MRGRVESVNVGVVRTGAWTGDKERTAIDKRPVEGPVRIGSEGLAGDTVCDLRHHGGPDQAVYAYSTADLDFWSAELDAPVPPGGVGENLTLRDVDCSGAVVGERWQVGDAVLVVRLPRIPCRVFAGFRATPDLVKRFMRAGRPGAYLSVESPAAVTRGDPVTVLDRPDHGVTVAEVMAAQAGRPDLLPRIVAARGDLGVRGRRWLDARTGG
ncbi:MOSC domain-containing protein [Pseudonocardia sp.]|uniref:MOSC domain-containing protein n=1 Tax=Pseudonocardia sp. TaxID=60912 RepID=UPI002607E657|nr:MOSC domain-containing protein [Pseudonocardia sp.]